MVVQECDSTLTSIQDYLLIHIFTLTYTLTQ